MRTHARSRSCPPYHAATLAALLCLATSGCAATPDNGAPAAPAISATPPIQAVMIDAVHQTGLSADHLKVASVEQVTWPDGSLGCPEPDLMYTQMLVPGYRIRIDADGKTLEYHTDKRGTLLLCPLERAKPPTSPPRS
jgi:hypothetical protein